MSDKPALWGAEAAHAELLTRIEELSRLAATSNEAETRLKAINLMLFDILDWELSDVEVEKYCRAVGFSDYVFEPDKKIALIIEAKKVAVGFTIPDARYKTDPVCFALIEQDCPEAGAALRQGLGYAASLGARY